MPANSNPNITPFTGSDQETDPILYFTDNTNEPRKLNIRRAIGATITFLAMAQVTRLEVLRCKTSLRRARKSLLKR